MANSNSNARIERRSGDSQEEPGGRDAHRSSIGSYVADADRQRELQPQGPQQQEWGWSTDCSSEVSYSNGVGLEGVGAAGTAAGTAYGPEDERDSSRWPTEPDVGRVADGVAHRVDRITALGNGQVPRVEATAWRLLYRRKQR